MKLSDKFTFGTYKGQTLETAIELDPLYVEGCVEEIEDFRLSWEACDALVDRLVELGVIIPSWN